MVGFESSNLPQSTSPNPAKIGSKVRINCPDSRLHEYEAELTGFTPSGNMKLANGSNMEWPESYALKIFDDEGAVISRWFVVTRNDFVELGNGRAANDTH